MFDPKALLGHAMTALVTLTVVSAWLRDRDGGRPRPVAGPLARPVASNPAPPARPVPPEVLAAWDADEQINIRVYADVNRSVVNITTAATSVGLFGDETTTGARARGS